MQNISLLYFSSEVNILGDVRSQRDSVSLPSALCASLLSRIHRALAFSEGHVVGSGRNLMSEEETVFWGPVADYSLSPGN